MLQPNVSSVYQSDGSLISGCSYVKSPYSSIPASFWWCVVTLMTVGYGDNVPVTPWGKFVAFLTMITSVLLLALPISVIGTEFTRQWLDFKVEIESARGARRTEVSGHVQGAQTSKAHRSGGAAGCKIPSPQFGRSHSNHQDARAASKHRDGFPLSKDCQLLGVFSRAHADKFFHRSLWTTWTTKCTRCSSATEITRPPRVR